VIFSVLKRRWTEERDTYERDTGQKVCKSNFLAIYARAHVHALSCTNILSAFRKTGIVPVNRNIITEDAMAPSLETSIEAALPFTPSTPVRALTKRLRHRIQASEDVDESVAGPSTFAGSYNNHRSPSPASSEIALRELASSQLGYLTHHSPLQAGRTPPRHTPIHISPPRKRRYASLLDEEARTQREQDLELALNESEARNADQKARMTGMQATAVLSELYLLRSQSQRRRHVRCCCPA